MASNEDRTSNAASNLDLLFNGEVRQFAEAVRNAPQPHESNQYPTRNEINRKIMDATRPLLDQIAELTRMVATLVEPRTQGAMSNSYASHVRERENPQNREGNESFPNSHRLGTRSDTWS